MNYRPNGLKHGVVGILPFESLDGLDNDFSVVFEININVDLSVASDGPDVFARACAMQTEVTVGGLHANPDECIVVQSVAA